MSQNHLTHLLGYLEENYASDPEKQFNIDIWEAEDEIEMSPEVFKNGNISRLSCELDLVTQKSDNKIRFTEFALRMIVPCPELIILVNYNKLFRDKLNSEQRKFFREWAQTVPLEHHKGHVSPLKGMSAKPLNTYLICLIEGFPQRGDSI